jgi:hypothetical protein
MEALFGEALKSGNGPWFALVVILLAMQWYDKRHSAAQEITAKAVEQMVDTLTGFCTRVDAAHADLAQKLAVLLERRN